MSIIFLAQRPNFFDTINKKMILVVNLLFSLSGQHIELYSPPIVNDDRVIAWINGGPTFPITSRLEADLKMVSDAVKSRIIWFDFCGFGQSTCAMSTSFAGVQSEVVHFMTYVTSTYRNVTAMLYSSASLTTTATALVNVDMVVYLNSVVSIPSSMQARDQCLNRIFGGFEALIPRPLLRFVDLSLCGKIAPIVKLDEIVPLMKNEFQRVRVFEGYNAITMPQPPASVNCSVVVWGNDDDVISKTALSLWYYALNGNKRSYIFNELGHYPDFTKLPPVIANACR